ncbi:hypothetical protein OS493_021272 [Desmophyllum pertusum]|uniref:Uncharacterized protein n=1 Tax=Desmophyllum pertusum TaxID=174260 RepID=A0A9W9ZBJ9_9CNID|nr:hypothetical protein OS493_021272 [Desmophyllum pertusum]
MDGLNHFARIAVPLSSGVAIEKRSDYFSRIAVPLPSGVAIAKWSDHFAGIAVPLPSGPPITTPTPKPSPTPAPRMIHRGVVAVYPFTSASKNREHQYLRESARHIVGVYFTRGPDNHPQGALSFRGTRKSYVLITNNGCLDTRYSLTIIMWVYPGKLPVPTPSIPTTKPTKPPATKPPTPPGKICKGQVLSNVLITQVAFMSITGSACISRTS